MKITTLRNGNQTIDLEKGDLICEMPHTGNDTPVGICPHCGEKLVIRDGKYGKFIGCKGFTKGCKTTYNFKTFKAIKNMCISLNRDRRHGHAFELQKSLYINES